MLIFCIKKRKSFTLAEILIVLAIIGIIAESTIPTLFMNVQKQEASARIKGFFSDMNQAVSLSEIDNGDASNWEKSSGNLILSDGSEDYSGQANASYSFFMKYLAPYLKYLKVEKGFYDSKNPSAYFETKVYLANGSTFSLHNGGCIDVDYDFNGDQKPNIGGQDVFIFLICIPPMNKFYFSNKNKIFGAYNEASWATREAAFNACKLNRYYCSNLLEKDGWDFKDDYPYRF